MDYQQLLLIKGISLSVLTVALTVVLVYIAITLHLWRKQLRRLDTFMDGVQNIANELTSNLKNALLGVSQSVGGVREIALMVWDWYRQQAEAQQQSPSSKKSARGRKKKNEKAA